MRPQLPEARKAHAVFDSQKSFVCKNLGVNLVRILNTAVAIKILLSRAEGFHGIGCCVAHLR